MVNLGVDKVLGNTHMAYGFILSELVFILWIRNSGEALRYNRVILWFVGMLGAWSPDLDGASGLIDNIFTRNQPWSEDVFLLYHRHFSHSIGFLIITLFCFLLLVYIAKKHYRSKNAEKKENMNPLGQVTIKYDRWNIIGFGVVFAGFLIYNEYTKYFAYFFILGAMIFFALTFVKNDKPFYGIAFFGGALTHHLCDFIACEWNPFGPWRPDIEIGIFLYCGDFTDSLYNIIMYSIFEIPPHILVLIIILRVRKEIKKYRFENTNYKS